MSAIQQLLASYGAVATLDSYTANMWSAYSLTKLLAAYSGSAIRVRRSSDNTEQDIGFSGTALDTSALSSFVGANSAFVTTWYDQSGNGRNMTQATTGKQPRIVNAGTYDGFVRFDGVDDCLQSPNTSGANNGTTAFLRGTMRSVGTLDLWLEQTADGVTNAGAAIYYSSANGLNIGTGPIGTGRCISRYTGQYPNSNVHAYKVDRVGTVGTTVFCNLFINGAKQTRTGSDDAGTITGNFAAAPWNLGSRNNGASIPANINVDVLLIYDIAKSDSDCTAISSLI